MLWFQSSFKRKGDKHGNIGRTMTRLAAKGYNQVEGVNYLDTFAPTA